MRASATQPFRVPSTYRPRMDSIQNPSEKVIVADGTRYALVISGFGSRVGLDFDATADPSIYGSFLSAGPIFHDSRAYGRGLFPGYNEFNVDYSIRYFNNSELHTAYFDGHAERITKQELYSDPTPWYPRGSRKTGGKITPEADEAWSDDTVPIP